MPLQKAVVFQFLSTPSARRATGAAAEVYFPGRFLSTPSARRATDVLRFAVGPCNISIHALREEGDLVFLLRPCESSGFLSTPSARRAT